MRFYRALLHLYPSGFRAEYGADMVGIFGNRRQRTRGLAAVAALYAGAIWDVVHNAGRVHADILHQDLRYTARTLLRAPGYAATAIVITALGVGATTAAFSITDHVLIRPLAFADAGRLVKVWGNQPQYSRMELSPANYRDWKAQSTSFDGMAAFSARPANMAGSREPRRLETTLVDAAIFPLLGASPARGRVFAPEDDRDGAAATLVVSHALWQSEFGADEDVLGKTVRLDEEVFTIIGVMPPDFTFPTRDAQAWRPFRFGSSDFEDRSNNYLQVVAKLKSGVSIDQARSELTTITEQLERSYPKDNFRTRATVIPLRGELSPQTRLLLSALFGASLSVLLIACTNLASLLLTRVLGRRAELAVRTALGSGRERLVRQLLTESLVLSALGGIIGVAIAVAAMPLLARLVPLTLPMGEPTVDLRVLFFATIITCGTGLGFGVVPALRVSRRPDMSDLREGTRSATSGRGQRLRAALVVAQVTVSVALLICAGLLIRALWRVQAVDPGFVTAEVLAIQTPVPWPKYAPTARRVDFYNRVLSETRTLPRVTSAAFISFVPMAMGGGIWPIVIQGAPALPADTERSLTASMRFVTPDFFTTLGIPFRRGRDVRESDTSSSQMVAVVSESFVRRYWPDGDPIGRSFTMAMSERTVVGVVADIRVRGPRAPERTAGVPAVPASGRRLVRVLCTEGARGSFVGRSGRAHAGDPPDRARGRPRPPAGAHPHASRRRRHADRPAGDATAGPAGVRPALAAPRRHRNPRAALVCGLRAAGRDWPARRVGRATVQYSQARTGTRRVARGCRRDSGDRPGLHRWRTDEGPARRRRTGRSGDVHRRGRPRHPHDRRRKPAPRAAGPACRRRVGDERQLTFSLPLQHSAFSIQHFFTAIPTAGSRRRAPRRRPA